MKKTSYLIASLSLSLLTIGAMAQSPANFSKIRSTPTPVSGKFAPVAHSTSHKVSSNPNYLIDNLAGDAAQSGGTFYNWSPYLFINSAFGMADTGAGYSMSANSVQCVFDTCWDLYTQGFASIASPGMVVEVDTIAANVRYHNTSGLNDTIILSVNSVNAAGYPTGTVYGVDTVVVTPTFFLYNTTDSMQSFYVIKPILVSAGARHGWNFSIQMTVKAPKTMDSIALVYYSQGSTACTALGGYYTPEPTTIGVPDGAVNCVNTFLNGMWYFNSPGQHGNGTSLSWPLTSGTYQGYDMNSGGYYWAPLPAVLLYSTCGGDTIQFSVQDVALFPSISVVPAGINNVTANGLSVGQNYPNPFSKTTQISYSLTKSSDVTFSVYDMTGRVLVNNVYTNSGAGQHMINLDANSFQPGVYFYTFNVNGNKVTKKMIITE